MESTERRLSGPREKAHHQERYAVSPYSVDEIAFTLEEIQRARDAAR